MHDKIEEINRNATDILSEASWLIYQIGRDYKSTLLLSALSSMMSDGAATQQVQTVLQDFFIQQQY